MGLIDRLRSIVQAPGDQESGRALPFRCLKCGAGHDREYESCPECGGSFVVPATAEDGAGPEEPPWQ